MKEEKVNEIIDTILEDSSLCIIRDALTQYEEIDNVEETKDDIYFKQKKLFDPEQTMPKVVVYGCGSIGSHTVIGLAKIGIKDITVYDFDKVEKSNLPAQFFDVQSKQLKIYELQRIVYQMTGTIIKTHNEKITEEFQPVISINTIHIMALDNIETRKLIFNKLIDFPVHLIDGRIGQFNYEKYYIDCMNITEKYPLTMEGKFSELDCGEKCLWIVNTMLSSYIIADVIKIIKNEKPIYCYIGNVMSEMKIVDRGEKNE